MKYSRLDIPDVVLFEPTVFADDRGSFFESFSAGYFAEAVGFERPFVQDNHSLSKKNVLRGLHYQIAPHAQGKLVRVVVGSAFDVAVDIRKGSPTFGRWVAAELTAQNRKQLWVPEGFAHGFLATSEETQFLYKTTSAYSVAAERCIAWNDESIHIAWPIDGEPRVSNKDAVGKRLADIDAADLF